MSATRNLIVAVLDEARQKFGPAKDDDHAREIARWVQRRVQAIRDGHEQIDLPDHKTSAAGERS